jgi:hypothetical protein
VGELFESEVSPLPLCLNGSLDVKADTVVPCGRCENDETLAEFHPFTSVRVVPHGLRAWTTG